MEGFTEEQETASDQYSDWPLLYLRIRPARDMLARMGVTAAADPPSPPITKIKSSPKSQFRRSLAVDKIAAVGYPSNIIRVLYVSLWERPEVWPAPPSQLTIGSACRQRPAESTCLLATDFRRDRPDFVNRTHRLPPTATARTSQECRFYGAYP